MGHKGAVTLNTTRRLAPLAATALLLAASLSALLCSTASSRAQGTCDDTANLAVLPSPVAPWKGAPLRVIVAAEKPADGALSLIAPDGSVAATSRDRQGGPPYFWYAEVKAPAAGTWHASISRTGCATVTRDIAVRADRPPPPSEAPGSVWPIHNSWNRATENLFSAWIQKLFDDPLDATPSWPALHEVLRDRTRNILFNYLGLNEDQSGIVLRPDCADLPYFLRAYFAFKMGLPFAYTICSRGGHGAPPKCYQWLSIQSAAAASSPAGAPQAAAPPATATASKRPALVASFARYLPTLANGVHSGSARPLATDNNTDHYTVALSQNTLRPGTIYADPYGHVLMIVQRIPETADSAGIILAVDGQPDGTVARKRFWRGNFLFAQDPGLGSPGFKRFRPIVRDQSGALRRLTNEEIARNPQYGDFSLEQTKLNVEAFYDRMDDVMSPQPLDPLRALDDAIASLDEQVKVRVTSVENGRKYQSSGKGEIAMPEGAVIFETNGAWEDFSTPSRDLRLLIAMDVVRGFPDRVARRPDRYAMPLGKSVADVKAELQSALAKELPAQKFSYTRTDGSQWTLTLQDVMDRSAELEMAYNPNDCVELRWGASGESDETSTCKRGAPAAQRAKMAKYRVWFHDRTRPPRP
jgi:hypothetical protein